MSERLHQPAQERKSFLKKSEVIPRAAALALMSGLFSADAAAQNASDRNRVEYQTFHEFTDADRAAVKVAQNRPAARAFRNHFGNFPPLRMDLGAIQDSRVPILLPVNENMRSNIFIHLNPDNYVASEETKDFQIIINGSRVGAFVSADAT